MLLFFEMDIVRRGKNCLQVVTDVLTEIKIGNSTRASSKLHTLKQDAGILENEAEKLAKRLEAIDQFYQEKDTNLLHQVGELGGRENQLREQKRNVESNLAGQQSVLKDKESKLSSAESNLQAAERKLRQAKQDEKRRLTRSAIGGAVLGLLTGG